MRRRGKVDTHHSAIREAFRRSGWQWLDTFALGSGAPDGIVLSPWDTLHWIEVKTGKPKLKPLQVEFHTKWPVTILTSADEALQWIRRVR